AAGRGKPLNSRRLKGQPTGGHAEQASKHRARDAGRPADQRQYTDFGKPRYREAPRPAGPIGDPASRAPSTPGAEECAQPGAVKRPRGGSDMGRPQREEFYLSWASGGAAGAPRS